MLEENTKTFLKIKQFNLEDKLKRMQRRKYFTIKLLRFLETTYANQFRIKIVK